MKIEFVTMDDGLYLGMPTPFGGEHRLTLIKTESNPGAQQDALFDCISLLSDAGHVRDVFFVGEIDGELIEFSMFDAVKVMSGPKGKRPSDVRVFAQTGKDQITIAALAKVVLHPKYGRRPKAQIPRNNRPTSRKAVMASWEYAA